MTTPWPDDLFQAPLLRGLSEHARTRIEQAGRLRRWTAGETIFSAQTPGDSLFIVHSGVVALIATRRGDDHLDVVRSVRRGESFGEGATLPGGMYRLTARVDEDATIAAIPVGVLTRETARHGRDTQGSGSTVAARQQRLLARQATSDLLPTVALTRDLSRDDIDLLLDAVEVRGVDRGQRMYDVGDPADGLYLLASGLVQLQTINDGMLHVSAYLSGGDFFGDRELLTHEPRQTAAVAMGACQVLFIPARAYRSLRDRNPGLVKRMRRIVDDREQHQQAAVEKAGVHTTRHVFADLYRMQMAQSLLTIDQDTCVRCGHCAWSCAATHGVARLVRRGDKVLTTVDGQHSNLLLPNSCQHCKNPACMIDCPTGAIGRDPRGEVFIREELCTGCGACAKACPWENIRMAPREPQTSLIPLGRLRKKGPHKPQDTQPGTSLEVATKCDLCRQYEAPACVQACPTGSLVRLDPKQAFEEVATLLNQPSTSKASATGRNFDVGTTIVLAAAILSWVAAATLRGRDLLQPGTGAGLWFGLGATLVMLALVGHSLPKRLVRLWMRRRAKGARGPSRPPARSRLRIFVRIHILLGLILPALVLGHAGTHIGGTLAGLLNLAVWLVVGLGLVGALVYRQLPRVLGRLERRGDLPEDLDNRRQYLLDRMQRELSGRTVELKRAARAVLLPYAHARVGWLVLLLSGRSLTQEQQRLKQQVTALFAPAVHPRLHGLDEVIKTAIDIRALTARRVLTACLRGWLIPHILLSGLALTLLSLHIFGMRYALVGGAP